MKNLNAIMAAVAGLLMVGTANASMDRTQKDRTNQARIIAVHGFFDAIESGVKGTAKTVDMGERTIVASNSSSNSSSDGNSNSSSNSSSNGSSNSSSNGSSNSSSNGSSNSSSNGSSNSSSNSSSNGSSNSSSNGSSNSSSNSNSNN